MKGHTPSEPSKVGVEIYTLEECTPCQEVKRLLQDEGIAYREYPIKENRKRFHKATKAIGRITVPIISINGQCFDYQAFIQVHAKGKLKKLLKTFGGEGRADKGESRGR